MSKRAFLLELRAKQGVRVANASRAKRGHELEVYDWIESLLEACPDESAPATAEAGPADPSRSAA